MRAVPLAGCAARPIRFVAVDAPVDFVLANDVDIETDRRRPAALPAHRARASRSGSTAAPTARRGCCARAIGFAGEIRATGEVLVDMLPLLVRTGFDAAAMRADQSQEVAERALSLLPRRPLPGRRDRAPAALRAPEPERAHEGRQRRLRRRRPGPGRPDHGARRRSPAQRRRRAVRFARRPGAARAGAAGTLDRRRQARLQRRAARRERRPREHRPGHDQRPAREARAAAAGASFA